MSKLLGVFSNVLHPRELYPGSFALLTFFLSQFSATGGTFSKSGPSVLSWLERAPSSAFDAFLLAGPLFILSFTLKRVESRITRYVLFHVGLFAVAGIFVSYYAIVNSRNGETITFNIMRIYVIVSAVTLFAQFIRRRLYAQIDRAEAALLETERQRSLLLTTDEATRREVAAFLHNRVQAGLVVTAMQLKMTAAKIGGPAEAELNSLIEELEQIRKFDVRLAGQQLSPDFELLDLEEALQDLIRGYKKTMEVHTVIDSDVTGLSAEMTLGIYRICEQAMLNAAVHGAATQCTIHIARDGAGARKIALTFENNGSWDASRGAAGAGSAVIEAWVKKFKGEWSLTGGANSVVTLKAVLFCELAG